MCGSSRSSGFARSHAVVLNRSCDSGRGRHAKRCRPSIHLYFLFVFVSLGWREREGDGADVASCFRGSSRRARGKARLVSSLIWADLTFLNRLHPFTSNNHHVRVKRAPTEGQTHVQLLVRSTTPAAPSQNDHIANVDPVTEKDLHEIEATFETDEGEGWVA